MSAATGSEMTETKEEVPEVEIMEDQGEEEQNGEYGKSRFAEKQAEIEKMKEGQIDPEHMQELAAEMSEQVSREVKSAAIELIKGLTPGFIQRAMNKKTYAEISKDSMAKADEQYREATQQAERARLEAKRNRRDRKKLKQNNKKAEIQKYESNKEKAEFKEKMVADVEMDYKHRRELQLAEAQAKIDKHVADMKEKAAKELLEQRHYSMTHWNNVAKEKHIERVEANKRMEELHHTVYRKQMDRMYDEWSERDFTRTRMQVAPAGLSDPIGLPGAELGVFGTPMGSKEYHGILGDGGHVPGLDDHNVYLLDQGAPFREYEDAKTDLIDSGAEEARKKALYDSLDYDSYKLGLAVDQIGQMQEQARRDLEQVKTEMLEVHTDQIGPPRRAPHNHEVVPTHLRKTRIFDLQAKIDEYQHCIEKAKGEKEAADKQLVGLSRELAVLVEQNKQRQGDLDAVNQGLGNLPIVMGRNISKVPGNNALTTKPKELMDAMVHQSKITQTKEMVDFAIKTHRERNELDQQLWVAKQGGNETKQEANHVISRLAQISEKMQKQYIDSAKLNLVDAIKVFQARGMPLRNVTHRITGLLPFWVNVDHTLSKNCTNYKSSAAMGGITFEIDPERHDEEMEQLLSNGVTLGEHRWGFAVGMIELPKNAMWCVIVTVARQGSGQEFIHEDESDCVSVSLGGSIGTLQKALVCYNRFNPVTGSVLYDVKFIFRGDVLAYRFDFSSSSIDVKKHLAVSVGQFEEHEMKGIEVVENPDSRRQRVLSSYVKMMRIDEQQGKFRETKLLEELVSIEESTSKFWDSDIVSKVPQRYEREYFMRILKAEILLEQKSGNAKLMEVLDKRAKVQAKLGKNLNKAEQSRDFALDQFMRRKRSKQSHVLEAAKALIGKRIEVFDPDKGVWRHVLIKDCVTRWLDNGLTACCTHVVHEHNEGMELIGHQFEVDLKKVRWFESAMQEMDEDAMLKWRRQKAFEKRLKEIDDAVNAKVEEFRSAYESFRTAEEHALRKHTEKTLKKLDKNVEKMAEQRSKLPMEQREIKDMVNSVLLDLRVGIIPIDVKVKPGVQALRIATAKWKEAWVKAKREEVMQQLLAKEQQVENRINQRRLVFIEMETGVTQLANIERYSLNAQINEIKEKEKRRLMRRVIWDKETFSKATPKSEVCEHVRTKCWGDNYAKGIRCKDCGKELSEIHHEESQMLGYGTGTSEELWDAIKRHRHDEAAFRFKDSQQLALVESERLKIEKERRVMEMDEAFFYDFNDLRVVYAFDRRHAKFIKSSGIFRQGLQWTEEELRQFEVNKRYEEIDRLKRENLVETQIEKFDPLNCIEEPPPTFRGLDEKRRANYNEFMFMMGRLHTYQKKIAYLKETRLELLTERTIFSIVLEFLHKESYGYDQELNEIERDLDKTGMLLATFEKMQELWKSANRIMAQANRDKMKAEMKQCGVWDDVKEAFERLSFLHDETLSLLKVKFLYDSELEGTRRTFEEQQKFYEEKSTLLKDLQLRSTRLQYCRPGDLVQTRYGDGIIRQHRQNDDMLVISLSFGEPLATVIIPAEEIVLPERARQKGEQFLMGIEDEQTQHYIRTERNNCQRERWAMQEEEQGLRELHQFEDLGKMQDGAIDGAISKAIRSKYLIMDSQNFKNAQEKSVNANLEKIVGDQRQLYEAYQGPRAGRPKKPGFWWQWQQKRQLQEELKKNFLQRAAVKAEYDANESFQKHRSDWIRDHSFKGLVEEVVLAMMQEIARDTYREGKNAKKSAERLSGLVFPNPRGMQYDAYRALVEVWKARKAELKREIEINRGLAGKVKSDNEVAPMTEEQLEAEKQQKRRERQERIRQKHLIAEMMHEDVTLKVFYAWELKQNLAERRLMKEEDAAMHRLLKEEEKARLEAEEERRKGYLVSDKLAEEAANKPAAKAEGFHDRRKQLQEEVIARRRKAEEHAFMILEDKAGEALREIDIKERLLAKMAKNMGVSVDELRSKGPMDTTDIGEDMFVEIPDWFEAHDIPEDWDDWPPNRQKKLVEEKTKIRERAQEREASIMRANKLLDKLEDTSYDKWREQYSVVAQEEMEAELVVMEMEETARQFEFDLQELEANIHRIKMYCQQKGAEELRAKADWKRKQTHARKRDRELAEAEAWLALCQRRAKQRDKIKRKVVENCLWIDTNAITGFHQRFKTELLRKRLYWSYFRRILDSIITRAEIIASERKMMGIQELLSANNATLVERSAQMKERWQEIQRDEYMRMRKSKLNLKLFGRHRREVLNQRFSSWVRFFLWNRGHREAFTLRYELLKRQMDIDRQFKEQLERKKKKEAATSGLRAENEGSPGVSEAKRREPGEAETDKEKSLGASSMQRHREHVVQCKDCNAFYLESQNHSMACRHHIAKFGMHCPRDCPKPGMTPKCASHRIRRWTCCDSTKVDAVGCCRKSHTPKPTDAVYDKLVNRIIERDRQESIELDAKLKVAREAKWEEQMMNYKRGTVQNIEDGIQAQRAKAQAYFDIKWT